MPGNILRRLQWQIDDNIDVMVNELSDKERNTFYCAILLRDPSLKLTSYFLSDDIEELLDLAYDWLLDEREEYLHQAEEDLEILYDKSDKETKARIRALVAVRRIGLRVEFIQNLLQKKLDSLERVELNILLIKFFQHQGKSDQIQKEILRLYPVKDSPELAPIHLVYHKKETPKEVLDKLLQLQKLPDFHIESTLYHLYHHCLQYALEKLCLQEDYQSVIEWKGNIKKNWLKELYNDLLSSEILDRFKDKINSWERLQTGKMQKITLPEKNTLFWIAVKEKNKANVFSEIQNLIESENWYSVVDNIITDSNILSQKKELLPYIRQAMDNLFSVEGQKLTAYLTKQYDLFYDQTNGYFINSEDEVVLTLEPDWEYVKKEDRHYNFEGELADFEKRNFI